MREIPPTVSCLGLSFELASQPTPCLTRQTAASHRQSPFECHVKETLHSMCVRSAPSYDYPCYRGKAGLYACSIKMTGVPEQGIDTRFACRDMRGVASRRRHIFHIPFTMLSPRTQVVP
ncbi:hypothetical protein G6O67_002127 [Ophiocordyceps sinensis]|uniref:Uncharacterized protein n=1 Tax=Ophiocordyceps sinensis TaxID=72228 RepID=A0A8H4PTJ1_9HYPO|nr:hypothetical protein G6O67_002127 [Ophiocordyceps sinensis]